MKEGYACSLLSWNETQLLAEKASEKIRSSGFRPDMIIGITRGGWGPAIMFSDLLGVRDLLSVRIEHWSHTATKDAKAVLKYPLQADLSGKKVLLVDDLTDTGDSVALAVKELNKLNPKEVRTATLIHKKQSHFKPDYFAKQTDEWEWIILPWNQNEDLLHLARKIMKEDSVRTNEGIRKSLYSRFGLGIEKETLLRILRRKDDIWL